MNRLLQTGLVAIVSVGCMVLSMLAACDGSNATPPACSALAACCANLGGGTSSCSATATSGSLSDAGCGAELATYQQNGQCPTTSPVTGADSAAHADAGAD